MLGSPAVGKATVGAAGGLAASQKEALLLLCPSMEVSNRFIDQQFFWTFTMNEHIRRNGTSSKFDKP